MFRNIHAILVFIVLASLSAFAHGQDAQIQGQVLDTTGAGISKALVRVVDQQTSTERKIETNDTGQYAVNGLVSGVYKIIVEAPGFSSAVSDQITLNPGQSAVMDFTLKVGATSADVVVTAEKRGEERLQDTPIPVTVISGQTLVNNDQLRLQDYYSRVPGLSMAPTFESWNFLSIRGVLSGQYQNPTVGIVIDDIPFGSSTQQGGGTVIPDFDPGDLARVEVLRGPQGTLYGASSMGGLIKYVTVDPSTDGFSGQVQTGVLGVYNGAEPGYNLRGSVNIPLTHNLAVRMSAFTRQDPGYIDNIETGQRGVNEAVVKGGHFSLLWKPSDLFSLKLGALVQSENANGLTEIDKPINGYTGPPLGDLQQYYVPGLTPTKGTQAYSANISTKLGSAYLTSLTGYNISHYHTWSDATYFDSEIQKLFGVTGTPSDANGTNKKLTEELRLSGSIWKNVDWLVGGYYAHDDSPYHADFFAANPVGTIVGLFGYFNDPSDYGEYAGFADATYHVTDRFNLQFGARESHITFNLLPATTSGPYVATFGLGVSPVYRPEAGSQGSAFTYLFTPQFKLSSDLMVYARLASGYRPGGANANLGVPSQDELYRPDKTYNYELGVKGDFLDHKLSVDASLYYIDWKNLQITLLGPSPTFISYTGNASDAKSEGVEISGEAMPLQGLTIDGWLAYDDAVLTKAFPANSQDYGVPGNRLPYSSPFSANGSVEQDFSLWGGAKGFVGATASFVGNRKGTFYPAGSPRQTYPSYTKTDLRAGVVVNSWTANLFVNNVADVRGLTGGGLDNLPQYGFFIIQPRTIGLNIVKKF